jgi:wobble nucleotide-excising tRNase
MIDKILKIEEVGRLQKTGGTSDNYRLTRKTMVYAGNTHGKSTLAAILRSLKENDPSIIASRLSFGSSRNPLVSLRKASGQNINFNSGGWSETFEDIRVFDDRYIRENFFSPDEQINDADQRTIETFILGAEGKELARKVAEFTEKQSKNSTSRSTITRQYTSQYSNSGVDLASFLDMQKDEDINTKIKASEDRLKSFQNQTSIKQSLKDIKSILDEYLVNDHKLPLSVAMSVDVGVITQHIKDHMAEGADRAKAKQFMADGLSLQKNKSVCVFCSQKIQEDSAITLVRSYGDVFSRAYLSLIGARNRTERFFELWNPHLRIATEISKLEKLGLDINLDDAIDNLKIAVEGVLPEIELKKNPAHPMNVGLFDKVSEAIASIDEVVAPIAAEYEQDLSEEANKERGSLALLKLQMSRFEQYWSEQCATYLSLQENHDKVIKPTLDETIKQLQIYSETIYINCMSSVNGCLETLGVNFRIKDLQYKGRSRGDLFYLIFDDTHDVGIRNGSSVSSYSTRHTLSESDKRALCFAFFIGSLQCEKGLGGLIILMDDPASSFDFERRTSMVNCLRSLMDAIVSPAQLLILTHDRDFAKTIDSKFRDNTDFSSLLLEWNASKGTSDFARLDINTNALFMSDFYKKLDRLHKYIDLPDSELDASKLQVIRHLIENLMKRKYYDKLKNDIDGKKSIESFIDTLQKPGMPYEDKGDLINKIRALSPHTVHHDQDNPGGYDPCITGPVDVRNILKSALIVMEEL